LLSSFQTLLMSNLLDGIGGKRRHGEMVRNYYKLAGIPCTRYWTHIIQHQISAAEKCSFDSYLEIFCECKFYFSNFTSPKSIFSQMISSGHVCPSLPSLAKMIYRCEAPVVYKLLYFQLDRSLRINRRTAQ
jgi:hypothetical protein